YDAAFDAEVRVRYPVIDALEKEQGYAAPLAWLLGAARVLACPVKVNPPNWQHGRVIYALVRWYLDRPSYPGRSSASPVNLLDVGTAKGCSAICAARALLGHGRFGRVTSIDVIDPEAAVRRNTVAEVGGHLTLRQTLEPWSEEVALVDFVLGKA